jgi:hypothetical protein
MARPVYSQRPSKAVTRRMLLQMMRRLGAVAPLPKYQYVGFGALEFVDFELAHRELGIKKMVSIEQNGLVRYEANRPYSGIRVLAGMSTDQLPKISWTTLSIVWLDYECALNETVISDVEHMARVLLPGSLLAVTLNAEPGPLDKRREAMVDAITEARVPAGVTDDTLGSWGKADVQRDVLTSVLKSALRARMDKPTWEQLLNIQYRDDARMQVLAGVVGAPALSQLLDGAGFDDPDFYRGPKDAALVVEVPYLTPKEQRAVREKLPRRSGTRISVPGVTAGMVKAYADVYMWLEPSG